jgi:TonB family protein
MTNPARVAPLIAIPLSIVLGGVVFVVACGVPLPTAPTEEATAPAPVEAPPAAAQQSAEPTFTPMTVRPALNNVSHVQQVLLSEYPVLLRDAGIGGSTTVWIHITTAGAVDDARVFEGSGYEALDVAAINVARAMSFSPAMNGDQVTDAWVQIPIRFRAVN